MRGERERERTAVFRQLHFRVACRGCLIPGRGECAARASGNSGYKEKRNGGFLREEASGWFLFRGKLKKADESRFTWNVFTRSENAASARSILRGNTQLRNFFCFFFSFGVCFLTRNHDHFLLSLDSRSSRCVSRVISLLALHARVRPSVCLSRDDFGMFLYGFISSRIISALFSQRGKPFTIFRESSSNAQNEEPSAFRLAVPAGGKFEYFSLSLALSSSYHEILALLPDMLERTSTTRYSRLSGLKGFE